MNFGAVPLYRMFMVGTSDTKNRYFDRATTLSARLYALLGMMIALVYLVFTMVAAFRTVKIIFYQDFVGSTFWFVGLMIGILYFITIFIELLRNIISTLLLITTIMLFVGIAWGLGFERYELVGNLLMTFGITVSMVFSLLSLDPDIMNVE